MKIRRGNRVVERKRSKNFKKEGKNEKPKELKLNSLCLKCKVKMSK